jgi:serine protease Do
MMSMRHAPSADSPPAEAESLRRPTTHGNGRRLSTWSAGLLLLAALLPLSLPASDGGIESLRQTGKAFAAVAGQVSPSVVNIQTEAKSQERAASGMQLPFNHGFPFGGDFLERFFGDRHRDQPRGETPRKEPRQVGQGSGFVYAPKSGVPADKSFILTNSHVVEEADKILVRLQDGREFEAKVTGRDPKSDVAVIEIPTGGLPPLALADSERLDIGEWVIAVGNPFGLGHTVTVGVVSAKGRTSLGINDYEDFIQTDAAINPGNSGGPLINLDAGVVGMNTAIVSRSGGYMGVGFAIPSNLIQAVAEQLIATGDVTRGYLGIVIQQLTPDLAQSFGMAPRQGILVAQVSPDSPAAKAGLRQGDVIVGHEGQPVTDVGAFRNRIALTPPGQVTRLTLVRDGREQEVSLTVGTLTKDVLAAAGGTQDAGALGLTVQTLTPQLAEQFQAMPGEGVVVTAVKPDSIAARVGIEAGTIILQVDHQPVSSAADFKKALDQSTGKRILLLLRKGEMQQFVVLSW